jgi:thymidylate synthase (FAD)
LNNCKLISYTQPAINEVPNTEALIAYLARVSNKPNQGNWETAPKLVDWLVRHKHFSPLEMVNICIEINTSRAISAQIIRHKSFSFQELSQRYTSDMQISYPEMRLKAKTNRQSSLPAFGEHKELIQQISQSSIDESFDNYNDLIDMGVAPESARMVLPMTTNTTIYMNGSLRSWFHYFEVRTDLHTQEEHRQIANECREIIKKLYPNVIKDVVLVESAMTKFVSKISSFGSRLFKGKPTK